MKNRLIAMFFLIIAVLVPLYAASGAGGTGWEDTGTDTPAPELIYSIVKSATLNIKAYKNSPNVLSLKVYDALTGTLDEIAGLNEEINIYPYIGKFISTDYTASLLKKQDENEPKQWRVGDKNKVLFSYLVTGSSVGTYTLNLTLGSFYRTDLTSTKLIKAHYELAEMGVGFPLSGGNTTLMNSTIKFLDRPLAGVDPIGKADGKLSVRWMVENGEQLKTQDIWTSEGVVLMAIDKNDYDTFAAGSYKADVKVELEVM